jgi:hypothetical protein
MQLFVLGATGGTDRELIRQALNRRHMSLGSWESRTPRRHEKAEETISLGIVVLASCVSSVPEPARSTDPRDHNGRMTRIRRQP